MELRGITRGRRVGLMRSAIVVPALAAAAVLTGAPAALAQSCLPPSEPPPPCSDCSPPPGLGDGGPPPTPSFNILRAVARGEETAPGGPPPPEVKSKIDTGGPADSDLTITYR